MTDFLEVTELPDQLVSSEQIQRLCNRYYWAGNYVKGKDVLEIACGPGQALQYLASLARSLSAGDISPPMVEIATRSAAGRAEVKLLSAESLPFADQSFDVVILFEAIYYIPSLESFINECKRILRPGAKLLIATANKDLYDFNPSPHSHQYLGVTELNQFLTRHSFKARYFGDTPLKSVSLKQKLFRPVKKIVTQFNLMPKTMAGKKLLKRLVFGQMLKMPSSITFDTMPTVLPDPIEPDSPNKSYKVIFCEAELESTT